MPTLNTPDAKQLEVLIGREAIYGTPPAGNWLKTFVYTFGLRPSRPLENDQLLGAGLSTPRDATEPAPGLTSHSGAVDVPLDMRHLGYWLTLLFGDPVTTGSGSPYTHVFTSGAAQLPSFTIGSRVNGASPRHEIGVVARSARFALGAEAGYRRVTLDLAGRDTLYPVSIGAGTPPTPLTRAPFPASGGILKIDGAQAAKILAFDGTYATGLEEERFVENSDVPSAYSPGQNDTTWSGSMRVRWTNTDLEKQAKAGTPSSIEAVYEIAAGLKLSLLAAKARFGRSGPEIGAPGRIEQTIEWRAYQDASAAMLVATLINDQASYFS
jgi:hypothetical protein